MKNTIASVLSLWKKGSIDSGKTRRNGSGRERRRNRLSLEMLEPRRLLSTITWNTTAAHSGGDWNVGSNWQGGVVPGAGDTAVIAGLVSPGTVFMDSGAADSVHSLTTDSSTTLEVITGSLSIGAASSSTFGGQVTVVSGASLTVGAGASLQLAAGSALTDNGTMTFASGDTVAIQGGTGGCCSAAPSPIVVAGTLNATSTTFNGASGTITANSGGNVIASSSVFNISYLDLTNNSVLHSTDLANNTFNMPIYVPFADVPLLGNNASFTQIEINNGTISSGTVDLNLIGTNTSMSYVFYQSFTVAPGATVAVGPGVAVVLSAGSTLTDNGTMTFASGDSVAIQGGTGGCCSAAPSPIVVAGTLNANSTTFNGASGTITANSGGNVIANSSVFNISYLDLTNNSVLHSGDLANNTFNMPIYVPFADVPFLANNASFTQIEINNDTISSGTLNLNLIGTNKSMSYVLYQSFTVGAGATVAVGPNVAVVLSAGSTLTDNGTMTFASGDTVAIQGGTGGCCSAAPSPIVVAGTLNANSTTFNGAAGTITANSGGNVIATNSVFNISYLDLTNNSVLNSGDLTNNTFNMPIFVPYVDVPYLGNNASFTQIEINNGTISSGTVDLNLIGTNTSMSYVFYQSFTVAPGATVAVGPGVAVVLSAGSTLTDNGTMTFASGDTVSLQGGAGGCCSPAPSPVDVGGTLNATDTTFDGASGTITANSGGHVIASSSVFNISNLDLTNNSVLNSGDLTNNTFNMPIFVPYVDVPFLGHNASFTQIEINNDTISSGTLNLNLIGTNTSMSYVFYQSFTVAPGATVAVGPGVAVVLSGGSTLTDNGTMTFASGDTVSLQGGTGGCCSAAPSPIVVAGTLNATSTTFNGASGTITANSGGQLDANSSTFSVAAITLNSGSSATLTTDVLSGVFTINSNTTLHVTGNDFSNLTTPDGLVAAGEQGATINVAGNYWGTTVAGIDAIIDDSNDNSSLPTVNFQPYVNYASGTSASPAAATFSTSSQTFNLTATITTTAGLVISEGTETFAIYKGSKQIGQTTTAVQVENGSATASYTLPAGTPAGLYTIAAYYSGSENYLPSSDFNHFLTVSPAATSTTTANEPATFSALSDQTVSVSAQVASTAGTINEGIVTFTILRGGNPVGASVSANVVANKASTTYDLLSGTSGGIYTIQAVYTDPIDFSQSLGTNQLTVSAASTAITSSGASTAFNEIAGEGIALSANVSSPAGTVSQGGVTFKVLNSSSQVVLSTVVNVSSGVASGNALLPAGTPVGSYVIQASYNGTASYAASLPSSSALTITAAASTTAAAPASIGFSTASQNVALSATVTSTAGPVNEGTEIFTIFSGSTSIATSGPVNVVAGVANATLGLPASTALGPYTIDAVYNGTTNFGGSSDSTHLLTVTQPPAAKLILHTQPSASATAGKTFITQPVIYEEDQNGNLETGDNSTVVTVALASGAGPLQGTDTATVIGGVATFAGLADNTAETITLKFLSGNLATATSASIVVSPDVASKLVIAQQPASSATAGVPFTTQPVVKEEDQYGNVITTDSTHTVTAARGTIGTAALQGSSLTVTFSSGVATFGGLSYDKAETMDIGFTTNAGAVSATASANVVVAPTVASQLVINQQPSTPATAGQPFATQPVIYEEDQFNNLETTDNSTVVTAMLNSGAGPLQGTNTATVSGGVGRFSNLADGTAETISLKFTSGTLASPPSSAVVVNPAADSKLVIHTQPSTTATAGQAFAIPPVVYLEDSNGNLATSDNTTTVTVALASGSGTLQGTKTVTAKGGIVTFAGLSDNTAETISLKFSGDGLAAGPSTNITVSPAAPFQLVIHSQPSPAATAGQPFVAQPVVYEMDQYGNLETSDNSTAITASLGSGNGPLRGTSTATLSGGVASFVGLADNVAGIISLNFAGAGFAAGPSNNVFISPGPATQLVIQTPPYSSVTAGNALTDPIVIDEEDQFGNIETGDNATVVTASLSSGAGTLNGAKTATVTAGVASFNGLEDDTAGVLALQFAAPSLPAVIANPSTVSPAAATRIVLTQPPAGVVSGQAFGLTVNAEDPFGNTDTSYNGPITVALASGSSGKLSGSTTLTATHGVASFTDLVDTSSGPVSLNVTGGSLASTGTGTITVSPAAPAKLVIQTQPSQSATAASPLTTQPVIYEEDQYGNLLTGDNSTTVTAYLASGAGPLSGNLTATVTGGVATFSALADRVAGTISLQFTGAGLTSIPSVPIVISPGAVSKLVIQTQPSATATAGQPFTIQPVVWEEDQYGNLETADNTSTVTASLANGTGPLAGTFTTSVSGGVATFTNLSDDTAETIALKFSAGTLSTGPSTNIVVNTAPSKLVIHTQPSVTATAGLPFATQPVIYEEDQFGNLDTGDNSTVVTVLLTSGAGPLKGTTSVTVRGGVATFTNLADDTAEAFTLSFSGGGLSVVPATGIVVAPAAASKLLIHTQPSSTATAGQAFSTQPVIDEVDQYGNIETADNSTKVTASFASGSGTLQGSISTTLSDGVATFANLAEDAAETMALKFSGGGLSSSPTSSIAVSAGTPTQLMIVTPQPSSVTAGASFGLVVDAVDQFGNVDHSFDRNVAVALADNPNGETLGGTTGVAAAGGVVTVTGLTLNTPGGVYSLKVSSSGLSPATTPTTQVAQPITPPASIIAPTIIGESIAMTPKTKKKKSVFSGFTIHYSTPMNASAVRIANSQMDATTIKRGKKSLTPVKFTPSIDPTDQVVTLKVAGKNPFAKGGQLTIVASSPTGVSNQAGVLLNSGYTLFKISANAKGITLA